MKRQMKRGKNQALYKYLPESWIDFAVRGKERRQYIAKVERWNSERLDGINNKRLLRRINEELHDFKNQGIQAETSRPLVGFGEDLTENNCDVLTPKASNAERGIIAKISPLTFYCKNCHRVYQFVNEEDYQKHHCCTNLNCKYTELTQFRQIYFCECGYATDRHNPRCKEHGSEYIKWYGDYYFICTKCQQKIQMVSTCKVCGKLLKPKPALDPAQFFVRNHSLIDLMDAQLESFIANTNYGSAITFAYWLNWLSKTELEEIITKGIINDPVAYQREYDKMYSVLLPAMGAQDAATAAKLAAEANCGSQYNAVINRVNTKLFNFDSKLNDIAESILEYDLVTRLEGASDLDNAVKVARSLNTNANPARYKQVAERFGIRSARVCDKIPFVSCSYGYTRGEADCKKGVQLHALKEEKVGRKNVYATKLNTEGVLFEFDRREIIEWLLANAFINAINIPNLNSEEELKLWFLNNIKPSLVKRFSPINRLGGEETYYIYRLLHSLSHLLIRAAADIGGLGKDSLSEYIFPAIPAVLIYCQNSQGFNLGSLFNTFEAYFDKWMNTAYSRAKKCIFDPICMESQKACTGCLFINEISCEHFNKDLDRSLVVGYVERESGKIIKGFWEE